MAIRVQVVIESDGILTATDVAVFGKIALEELDMPVRSIHAIEVAD